MNPKKSKSKNEMTNFEIYKKLKDLRISSYNKNRSFEDNIVRFAGKLGITADRAIILLHIGDWLPELLPLNAEEYPAEIVIQVYDKQRAQAISDKEKVYQPMSIDKATPLLPEDGFSDFNRLDGTKWLERQMQLNGAELPKELIPAFEEIRQKESEIKKAPADYVMLVRSAKGLTVLKQMFWHVLDQFRYIAHPTMQPTPETGKALYYMEEMEIYFRDGARGVFERFSQAKLPIPHKIVSEVIFAEKHCLEVEQHLEVDMDIRADNLLATTDQLWRVLVEAGYCITLN